MMEQGEAESPKQNSPQEEQDETASLPIDFCPGMTPKEGDILKVKVVSVDADNGSMDVVYVPFSMGSSSGGIKENAAKFDEGENT